MTTIMTILGLGCLGYLLVVAEPMILLRRWVGFKEERYDQMSKWMRFFHRLNSCPQCFTFWLAMIYHVILGIGMGAILIDPLSAAISSVVAGLIEKMMQ